MNTGHDMGSHPDAPHHTTTRMAGGRCGSRPDSFADFDLAARSTDLARTLDGVNDLLVACSPPARRRGGARTSKLTCTVFVTLDDAACTALDRKEPGGKLDQPWGKNIWLQIRIYMMAFSKPWWFQGFNSPRSKLQRSKWADGSPAATCWNAQMFNSSTNWPKASRAKQDFQNNPLSTAEALARVCPRPTRHLRQAHCTTNGAHLTLWTTTSLFPNSYILTFCLSWNGNSIPWSISCSLWSFCTNAIPVEIAA